MRWRDQNKADVALAGFTLVFAMAWAGYEGAQWARQRLGRRLRISR